MLKICNLSYKKVFIRISYLFLAAAMAANSPITVHAETQEERIANQQAITIDSNQIENWPQGPVVTAEAAILMEAETGTILYSKNIHQHEYPASCTKILTCLIASELCEMDEMVYMSSDAIYDTPRDSNHIALDVGEAITMEQALSAILIRSANEVSFGVAEHITGTCWEDFAAIMNERAKELGCLNSNFVNPNGLPDENHYTTAYDLATIARAFFDNEMLSKLSRTIKLDIPASDTQPDHIIEHTKNQLLPGQKRAYEYLVGSKTGYTNAARNCLVSCAEKDGLKLICVVLKDESPAYYDDTLALFEYGFSNFTTMNVSQSETKYNIDDTGLFYSDNDIFGSSKPLLSLNTEDFIVLPRTASFGETVSTISYDTVEEDQAALITYTWNGVEVGTASVDFVDNSETSFDFGSPVQVPQETAPEEEENPVVFINIVKVILIIVAILAGGALLFILFLLAGNLLSQRSGNNRRRRRRRRSSTPYRSVSLSMEQRRRQSIRNARKHRRKRSRRPNRFRDYDF